MVRKRTRPPVVAVGAALGLMSLVLVWSGELDIVSGAAHAATNAESPGDSASFDLWRMLGRFHPLVLHFPIGFLALLVLLELYAIVRPGVELRRALSYVAGLTALSGVAAAGLGLLLGAEGGYDETALGWHRWLGIIAAVSLVIVVVLHVRAFGRSSSARRVLAYRGFLALSFIVLSVAGHLGGNLTHGSDFLLEHAPAFVQRLSGRDARTLETSAVGAAEEHFVTRIWPIFESKCVQCHGPEKQKAGYRLDVRDIALEGGSDEVTAIVPGKPLESHLVRRILLSPDHDDVMPPAGKTPLEPEEILAIVHWIELGAAYVERGATAAPEAPRAQDVSPVGSPAPAGKQETPDPPAGGESASSPADELFDGPVDFARDVQPIFEKNCIRCHGPKRRKASLALHTWDLVAKGGKESGPVVRPGRVEESPVTIRVSIPPDADVDEELMPPADEGGPLAARDISILRRWVAQGASWPEGLVLVDRSES